MPIFYPICINTRVGSFQEKDDGVQNLLVWKDDKLLATEARTIAIADVAQVCIQVTFIWYVVNEFGSDALAYNLPDKIVWFMFIK